MLRVLDLEHGVDFVFAPIVGLESPAVFFFATEEPDDAGKRFDDIVLPLDPEKRLAVHEVLSLPAAAARRIQSSAPRPGPAPRS
ncbi:hypothetical protein SAMN05216338_1014128 [Bradyrhizobium sp. Rc2d]|nr:hypothetical protein SAMN05216338_1014128 [Bradyrhizobium sp. Rc2d]